VFNEGAGSSLRSFGWLAVFDNSIGDAFWQMAPPSNDHVPRALSAKPAS
jgi:hypothetical protein